MGIRGLAVLVAFIALVLGFGSSIYVSREELFGESVSMDFNVEMEGASPQTLRFLSRLASRSIRSVEPSTRASFQSVIENLSLEELSHRLQSVPWVSQVQVRRQFPSRVEIQIRTKDPILGYVSDSGEIFLYAPDGSSFPAQRELPARPIVVTREIRLQKETRLRTRVLGLLSEIPIEGAFSLSTISELNLGKRDRVIFTVKKLGVRVHLGNELIALKSGRVAQVIDYLRGEAISDKLIDADFAKKVLVSPTTPR